MSALIAFINQHDGAKVERTLPNGRLLVSSVYVDAKGQAHRVSEEIGATMKAARDWLGY